MNKRLSVAMVALLLSACDKPAPVEPAAEETPAPVAQTAAPNPAPATATAPAVTDAPAPNAAIAAPAQAPDVPAAGDRAVDDSIDGALGDHTRYRAFIGQFQKAVADKDAAAVAALVHYPFGATIDGKTVVIKDAKGFVAQYDKIVTPAIAQVIVRQKYSDLMVNYQGVMFGSGEAWINGVCKDNACKVYDVKVMTIQPGA